MSISPKNLKNLPDTPGVYFFLGRRRSQGPSLPKATYPQMPVDKSGQGRSLRFREVLYIGKAGSLRDRVRSYFLRDIAEARGAGIQRMVEVAEDVAYEKTDSVLEAVLLEAELIKKFQPKYNVREKDDKSFNYVVITKEPARTERNLLRSGGDFPRVLLVRGRELSLKTINYKLKTTFGPFPNGGTLRAALSIIRKIFPYRDKCTPQRHANILQNISMSLEESRVRGRGSRGCFNRQIGLCPGVCTGEISQKEYAKTIRNITLLFQGKKKSLLVKLAREMKAAAKAREFERAAKLRNTIFALKHIQDISLIKREPRVIYTRRPSVYITRGIHKVEAYDIAHTSGKEIVGVMTVVYRGEPDKDAYRKFKIKNVTNANDTAALKEVLERRLAHAEWPFPDLVVMDGGKAQMNVAERVLKESGLETPVVSVVKDEHHHPKNILGRAELRKRYENEILLANSEAHRFAIKYHREKMRRRK